MHGRGTAPRGVAVVAIVAACVALGLPGMASAGKARKSSLKRPEAPVVLGGDALPDGLSGIEPDRLVAFRNKGGKGNAKRSRRWRQVPVQVDERFLVPFGPFLFGSGPLGPGTVGSVYGTGPGGPAALQYADPGTFVGPDSNPALDADDEIALMARDAGGRAPGGKLPPGVSAEGAARVALKDPLGRGKGFVYLFPSDGSLDPSAGKDYVEYDFVLESGDYRSTYQRHDGPNPERSRVTTDRYGVGFSDRWIFDLLDIEAGKATGVDILDGAKVQTGCQRSNDTFSGTDTDDDPIAKGEGAFVVNKDGPVRAIRSYVGSNSGIRNQRTHFFYAREHVIQDDVRVHPLPGGPSGHYDLSPAAIGMKYRNSTHPGKVLVDGQPDPIGNQPADWHLWSGKQGSLFLGERFVSSFADRVQSGRRGYYEDDSTPQQDQCWGDAQAIGDAGTSLTAGFPNTDPALLDPQFYRGTSTMIMSPPGADADNAKRWAKRLDTPLRVKARDR